MTSRASTAAFERRDFTASQLSEQPLRIQASKRSDDLPAQDTAVLFIAAHFVYKLIQSSLEDTHQRTSVNDSKIIQFLNDNYFSAYQYFLFYWKNYFNIAKDRRNKGGRQSHPATAIQRVTDSDSRGEKSSNQLGVHLNNLMDY